LGYANQQEQVLPEFKVFYPLLCYTSPLPNHNELYVVNLANDASKTKLELENMKLWSFVGYRGHYSDIKVCFLAYDYS